MLIVLFLLGNKYSYDIRLSIDNQKYIREYPILILLNKYDENNTVNFEVLLFRFCNIHKNLEIDLQ